MQPITKANTCSHTRQGVGRASNRLPTKVDRDTEEVRFRHAATATLLAAFIACFSACGGDDGDGSTQGSSENEATVEGDAPAADVEVIEAWSDALREGDIDGAADYFAIPSVTENGVLLRISRPRGCPALQRIPALRRQAGTC